MTETTLGWLTSDADESLGVAAGNEAIRDLRDIGMLPRLLGHGSPISHEKKVELLDPVEHRSLTRDLLRYWRLLRQTDQAKGLRIRGPKVREFGHPQEWESDKISEIVGVFIQMHRDVASACGDPCPVHRHPDVALQAAVTYLHEHRETLPTVDTEIIRSMIALYMEIGSHKEFHTPDPEKAVCPRCGEHEATLVDGEDGLEFYCKCGYFATRDENRMATRAANQALDDKMKNRPVLVSIQYVVNYYKIPRSTVDSWIRRKKITKYKDKSGVQVDKREVDAILHRPQD